MKRTLVWLPVSALWLLLVASLGSNGWAQAPLDTEAESKLVKSVVDESFKASNARKLDLLLAHFSDDAMIDSKAARGKVSKSAYKDVMSKAWERDTATWAESKNLKVSIVDATHAVVEGMIYIHLQSGQNIIQKNEWKLEKRDGRWLIVETNYK
jgi:hypothetical protein